MSYVYNSERSTVTWHLQPKYELELRNQNVNSSCCGESRYQSV